MINLIRKPLYSQLQNLDNPKYNNKINLSEVKRRWTNVSKGPNNYTINK